MMALVYMTLEQAIDVHAKTVEVSGGGALGQLDMGKLDSVLSISKTTTITRPSTRN